MGKVYKVEGAIGLWAGNSAALLKVFPHRGIAFAANDALNDAFGRNSAVGGFVAGGAAGLLATGATSQPAPIVVVLW